MAIRIIGLDFAKNVFQLHGVDETGKAALKRKLQRCDVLRVFAEMEPALVGIEACHAAHYWAREIAALGHRVRLMPPQFVKPYVKSQKNDAADAEAICEAVQRPNMIRQRSSLISAIKAHFAKFGIVAVRGDRNVERMLRMLAEGGAALPEVAREMLGVLAMQLRDIASRVRSVEARLLSWHRSNAAS